MARARYSAGTQAAKPIEQYAHRDKTRPNNPPVGLVSAETDPEGGRKSYAYDPHLDPRLEAPRVGRRPTGDCDGG